MEKNPGTILIVDDEKVLLNTTSEMLRMLGHRVTTCQTGKEALEKYDKIWKSVDIVILDMIMPQMDGRQVYNLLRQINPSVSVLIASGFVEDDQYDDLLSRGIKGILRKPFHLENLSDKIIEIST
jgi:CheY-like chemotaxis protein